MTSRNRVLVTSGDLGDAFFGLGLLLASPLLITALILPFSLWNGFILEKLWEWFVASTFHIHALGFGEAVGLMLLLNFVIGIPTAGVAREERTITMTVLSMLLAGIVALLAGWLIIQF